MSTTLVTITVPTSTAQVKLELHGVPEGITPLGPLDIPAPLLYYMLPVAAPPGQPFVAEGFILPNDVISLSGVFSVTYYLVTVFDPVNDDTILSQAFYFIPSGDLYDLDTAMSLSQGNLPVNPVRFDISSVPVFANNTAATIGGLTPGCVYRSGGDPDALYIVH